MRPGLFPTNPEPNPKMPRSFRSQRQLWWCLAALAALGAYCSRDLPLAPISEARFSISGQIAVAGAPARGVTVSLAGEQQQSARTDSLGRYSFARLGPGLYSLRPEQFGYAFLPQQLQVELADTSLYRQDFNMSPQPLTILTMEQSLDFGQVRVGDSLARTLSLTNIGAGGTLVLERVIFTDSAFTLGFAAGATRLDTVLTDTSGGTAFTGRSRALALRLELPPAQLVTLPVLFRPDASGALAGKMILRGVGSASPVLEIPLTGSGFGKGDPAISVEPAALSFGAVLEGQSLTRNLTVTNIGNDTLAVSSIISSHPAFKVAATALSLLPGQGAQLSVTFTPSDTIRYGATLTIASNAVGHPALTVPLDGRGSLPALPGLAVTPEAIEFGTVFLDSTAVRELVLTNTGADSLLVTGVVLSSALFRTDFPGNVLIGPGQRKSYQVSFIARQQGRFAESLSLVSGDPVRTVVEVPLTAEAMELPPFELRLNPAALSFGEVEVGASSIRGLWLVNPGTVPIGISQVLSGLPGVTVKSDSLYLERRDSLQLDVTFAPLTAGEVSGFLTLRTNVFHRDTINVLVTGLGRQSADPKLVLERTSLEFLAVELGDSAGLLLKVLNQGQGRLILSRVESDNATFRVALAEQVVIEPGAQRSLEVFFKPSAAGIERGTLKLFNNDPLTPVGRVSLVGTGIDRGGMSPIMSLSTRRLDFGRVIESLTGELLLAVENLGRDTLRVEDVHFDSPLFTVSPRRFDVAPGRSVDLTLSFTPDAVGPATGRMTIYSNDQIWPRDTLAVRGEGVTSEGTITEREVFVEGGVFTMGDDSQPEAMPRHLVSIASFYMDKYEVTNAEFAEFIAGGGYDRRELWTSEGWQWRTVSHDQNFDPDHPRPMYWGTGETPWATDQYSGGADSPVVGVNWYEASAYARWRGRSLPTEAQWEYAARDRNHRIYPWGADWREGLCNHGKLRSPYYDNADGFAYAAPVGSFAGGASPLGLFDLAGNVWEWCKDWYGPYSAQDQTNPVGASAGLERAVRGGSWYGAELFCRSFHRDKSQPQMRYRQGGFRLVRNQ